MLHTFEEGRIEQWLEGRSPTYEDTCEILPHGRAVTRSPQCRRHLRHNLESLQEIRTEESIRRIACKLREFHDRRPAERKCAVPYCKCREPFPGLA